MDLQQFLLCHTCLPHSRLKTLPLFSIMTLRPFAPNLLPLSLLFVLPFCHLCHPLSLLPSHSLKLECYCPLLIPPPVCPLDPLPSRLLLGISPAVIPFLHHIIDFSLSSRSFLTTCKHASTSSTLKKFLLDPSALSNSHPIALLLPFTTKLLECAAYSSCLDFLSSSSSLDTLQTGFCPMQSIKTALTKITDDILLAKSKVLFSVLYIPRPFS